MKFDLNNTWVTRIISFVLALLLFLFVSYENSSTLGGGNSGESASYSSSEVIPDVPVEIRVDEEEYFVTGVPDSVTVRMEGPQAVIAQTAITQNFNITTPNLNSLGEGTHQISLEAEDISDQIDYTISPSDVTVEIENKVTETFEPSVQFSESEFLAEGYVINDVSTSQNAVEVNGAASTMDEISEVRIVVEPSEENITDDFTMNGNVVVLDESGEPLNVNAQPQQIAVSFDLEGSTTEAPISLEQTGTPVEGYDYEISIAEGESSTVELRGDAEAIQSINEYTVPVDVSGITETTEREVPILFEEGITDSNLDSIQVNVEVTEENS